MPRGLPRAVKKSLEKSKDSALLAVETYNKPAIKFKSGGYIILMVIAWTSLFHAYFFKKKKKPFYKKNGRFLRVEGDYHYWDLAKCIREYFGDNTTSAIRKNLEFFIPMRNMVEHKSLPEIDSDIFAECQSLLLNYDKIVEREFGVKYCLRESLAFTLQMYPSSKSLNNAVVDNPNSKSVVDFIRSYRSSISTEILKSGEYSFKAFLIQVSNHDSKNALPVQFFPYDRLNDDEKRNVDRVATLVKNKTIHIPVSNKNMLKPGEVVRRVQAALGNEKVIRNGKEKDKFNQDTHTRCWKNYKVRPENGTNHPEHTNSKYCIYDEPNRNYLYKEDWVDFLYEELSDQSTYDSLYQN